MRDKVPRVSVMHTDINRPMLVVLTVPQRYGTVKVRWVAYPQDICAFEVGDQGDH